jgi:hypothetical protein
MMAARSRQARKGPRLGRWLLLLLVLGAVVLLVLLLVRMADRGEPGPPGPVPPTGPQTQPASCPDVQLLAVPGTWESAVGDDPLNPTANPNSLMQSITRPLQERFGVDRALVYTLPYPAEFALPGSPPQMSYNESRAQGTVGARDALAATHAECPLTSYLLVGFSQGAVIAGDIAAEIGAGSGPVPADRVLGVALIADGRRDPDAAPTIGPPVGGVGLEVSFAGLSIPFVNIDFTGKRPGGFGELADRTVQFCAPNDGICDAPVNPLTDPMGALGRLGSYANNPVHAMYASFVVDDAGTTTTQWVTRWAEDAINQAPVPAHS